MLGWLTENMGTLLIGLFVFVLAALAARSVYRSKKKGGCTYGCPGCSHGSCREFKK